MRTRARWTPRTRLLWLFAAIVAGFLAWLEWSGRRADPPRDVTDSTVEFEVVE